MKRYDKYKQTGTPWIGKIPSHWESKRLRFVCEFRNGYTPSKANPDFWTDGTIPWYRMEDIRDSGRHLKEAKQYVTEDAVKGGGLFDAGSFILATTATIGEHAVLIVDSQANQQFTNLKIRKSLNAVVDNEFFFYFLYVIDDYCKSTTKTATFAAVNIDDLKNFEVAIPPLQEQHRIVNYINNAISTYDAVISTQERRIALLEELKQSVITEAVTHGINPNATLRPSGIDWIGNIPQHWEVMPLKRLCTMNKGITFTKADIVEEGEPVISYGQIHSKDNDKVSINDELIRHIPNSFVKQSVNSAVSEGDFIFADTSEDYEGSGNCVYVDKPKKIYGGYHTIVLKMKSKQNKYLAYLFTTDNWRSQIRSRVSGVKVFSITQQIISLTTVILPPLSEQQEIVAYIEGKIKPIDASIAKAKREIELLKELKQSVITEAVTGKIKVY